MKHFLAALLAALTLFSLTGCGKTESPAEQPAPPPPAEIPAPEVQPPVAELLPEPEDPIDLLLDSMTLEEKIGQLFFVRVPAESAVEDVAQYHLGGYILFGRDTKDKTANDLIQTIAAYQEAADIPLLIGVDEEGGTVVRVSSNGNLRASGERVARNMPIQGTVADIIKLAMIKTRDKLLESGLDARVILQVHDELIVEAEESVAKQAGKILEQEMENAAELLVPLLVDIHRGKDWYTAKG